MSLSAVSAVVLDLLAHGPGQTDTAIAVPAPAPSPVATSGSDIAILVVLIAFALAFVVLGAIFLKKKKAERIAALTTELEKPRSDAELPPATGDGKVPVGIAEPKAEALIAAEREAARLRAEQEEARRAKERAAQKAAAGDDAAKAALAEAQAREQKAQSAAALAQERAKELRTALGKSRDSITGRLARALAGKEINDGVLDDVEQILFSADVGARTADRLLQLVKKKLSNRELTSTDKVVQALRDEAMAILAAVPERPLALTGDKPRVFLILGVNGAGKTTTIGKLASQLKAQGHKVLLGAGDTFRAAAQEQLDVWAKRADVPIVTGADNSDPSAVLFEAVKTAKAQGVDVVLCDTAGRLHTKVNLMEELKKVARSLGKAHDGAPHETLLVLDATVGQNAIAQAREFGAASPLTGIILTKLDGTAKGGVILGIVDELKVPVRYIGVGEKITDLRAFDGKAFVDALFGDEA